MTDRITIATDMARERLAEAKLGVRNVRYPIEFPNGSVNLVVTLTVSAADIDAQIEMERERGVERKVEDARHASLVPAYVIDDLLARMPPLDEEDIEDVSVGLVRKLALEIRDSRAAFKRIEALIADLRRCGAYHSANNIEAALRGERSGT